MKAVKGTKEVKEVKTRTFGPNQKGFDRKNPTTWSKGFRERVLDMFFAKDPKGFTMHHEALNGNGAGIIEALKNSRGRTLTRWTNVALAGGK